MQKKLCFVLSLTIVCYFAAALPVNLDALEFDKLDTDLDDLKYDVEEEDLDGFSKLLDDPDKTIKESGFRNKNTSKKRLKSKHDIEDLKNFFKTAGVKDQGRYNDDDFYAVAKALAAEEVGIKGTEERKYRKGTKTRGFHKVHHKDEYKKNKEFYDDDETVGAIKKVGGKVRGFKIGGGAGFSRGKHNHEHSKGIYAKAGFQDRGFLDKKYRDFSDDQSYEGSFDSES